MIINKYIKKQKPIEAMQWTGTEESFLNIQKFVGGIYAYSRKYKRFSIPNMEGVLEYMFVGDYVIKNKVFVYNLGKMKEDEISFFSVWRKDEFESEWECVGFSVSGENKKGE